MEDAPAFQSAIDWTSELVIVGLMEDTSALQSVIDGTSEMGVVSSPATVSTAMAGSLLENISKLCDPVKNTEQ